MGKYTDKTSDWMLSELKRRDEKEAIERGISDADYSYIPPRKTRTGCKLLNPEHGPMTSTERGRRFRARFRGLKCILHNSDYFEFRDLSRHLEIPKSILLAKIVVAAVECAKRGELGEFISRSTQENPAEDEDDIAWARTDRTPNGLK